MCIDRAYAFLFILKMVVASEYHLHSTYMHVFIPLCPLLTGIQALACLAGGHINCIADGARHYAAGRLYNRYINVFIHPIY